MTALTKKKRTHPEYVRGKDGGRPTDWKDFCPNESCDNYLLYASPTIKKNAPVKLKSGEVVQNYFCKLCKKSFLSNRRYSTEDNNIQKHIASELDAYVSYEDIARYYGVNRRTITRNMKELSESEKINFEEGHQRVVNEYPKAEFVIQEKRVHFSASKSASVFFIFKKVNGRLFDVRVCEDTDWARRDFIQIYGRGLINPLFIVSESTYPNTKSLDKPPANIHWPELSEALEFKRWVKSKNIEGLEHRMILFGVAYRNRRQKLSEGPKALTPFVPKPI